MRKRPRVLETAGFLIPLVLSTVAAWGQDTLPGPRGSESGAGTPPQGANYRQSLSYAMGVNIGTDLRRTGIELDLNNLVAGIADSLRGAPLKMSEAQLTQVMQRFQREMEQKAKAQMADLGSQNKQKGEAFLTANGAKEGVQTTPSGLQYRVIASGAGGVSPTKASTVKCHYEGTSVEGVVFDSSYKRGQPAEFPVGGVIAGWTEVLQLMKPGDQWEVFIPSELAYGKRGAPPAIGPDETLIFKIELLEVK